MGGYGSGWRRGSRYTADAAFDISIGWILRKNRVAEGVWQGTLAWSRHGEELGCCGYVLRRDSVKPTFLKILCTKAGVPFEDEPELAHEPMPKGGFKTYLVCPYCRNRRMQLYFSQFPRLCCRNCANYTYQSCQESRKHSGVWREVLAALDEEASLLRNIEARARQRERCRTWRMRTKKLPAY